MADLHPSIVGNSDRRRAVRADDAQGETVLVWIAGSPPQTAVFLDESHLGIGLALHDEISLKVGQRVEVVFRGTAQPGLVSSLRSYRDVTRVGLHWLNPAEPFSG